MPSKRKIKRRQQTDEEVERNRKLIEQPNTELMIIKTIQGLVSTANRELGILDERTSPQATERKVLIGQALEEIDLFQRTTLNGLQKAFE